MNSVNFTRQFFAVWFQKGLRCENTVFTMQQTTNCFTQRNSAVFVSVLGRMRN